MALGLRTWRRRRRRRKGIVIAYSLPRTPERQHFYERNKKLSKISPHFPIPHPFSITEFPHCSQGYPVKKKTLRINNASSTQAVLLPSIRASSRGRRRGSAEVPEPTAAHLPAWGISGGDDLCLAGISAAC